MDILQKFGNPLQARVVSTIVERIAESQITNINNVIYHRFNLKSEMDTKTFFRGTDEDGKEIMSVIVSSLYESKQRALEPFITEITTVILERFGKNAEIDEVVYSESPSRSFYALSWGVQLLPEMVQRFESQELPTFQNYPDAGLMTYRIRLREPIVNERLYRVREAAEACGAVISLVPINDRELEVITVCDSPYPNRIQPEQERKDWLIKQLSEWGTIDSLCDFDRVRSGSIEKKNICQAEMALPAIEQADDFFICSTVVSMFEKSTVLSIKECDNILLRKCIALFGAPRLLNEGWSYKLKVKDALLIIEGVQEKINNIFMVPKKLPVARAFDKIIEVLSK